jgi:hypothetical protein
VSTLEFQKVCPGNECSKDSDCGDGSSGGGGNFDVFQVVSAF